MKRWIKASRENLKPIQINLESGRELIKLFKQKELPKMAQEAGYEQYDYHKHFIFNCTDRALLSAINWITNNDIYKTTPAAIDYLLYLFRSYATNKNYNDLKKQISGLSDIYSHRLHPELATEFKAVMSEVIASIERLAIPGLKPKKVGQDYAVLHYWYPTKRDINRNCAEYNFNMYCIKEVINSIPAVGMVEENLRDTGKIDIYWDMSSTDTTVHDTESLEILHPVSEMEF